MKSPFTFTYGNVAIFAHRVRLEAFYVAFSHRLHLGISGTGDENEQSPVTIDLPLKDRAAYERAAKAFNDVMDEHDRRKAAKNDRRRAARSNTASPSSAHL